MSEGPPATPRFRYLDGLRGVAAASVLLHHAFHGSEYQVALKALCGPLGNAAEGFTAECSRGVQIFFVLSGFVIAYSIRKMIVTPRVAGNFILRRQIRLDPTFWVALFLAYLNIMGAHLSHPEVVAAPTGVSFVTSMFYVNNILHIPDPILGVSWTLCLEIQFYLILIAIIWIAQKFFAKKAVAAQVQLVLCLALLSLGFRVMLDFDTPIFGNSGFGGSLNGFLAPWYHFAANVPDKDGFPWFIGNWFFFASGSLIWWTLDKRVHPAVLLTFNTLILAAGIIHPATLVNRGHGLDHQRPSLIIGSITIWLIYGIGIVVMKRHQMIADQEQTPAGPFARLAGAGDAFLSTKPIQYLGKISYSLYLIHFIMLDRVYRLGMHLMHVSRPEDISRAGALLWFVLAVAAAIGAADILYRLVERPTMRWASSLKPKPVAVTSASPTRTPEPAPAIPD